MSLSNSIPIPTVTIPAIVVILFLIIIQRFFTAKRDSREPPFITPGVPGVGHILNIIRNGSNYFRQLDSSYAYGIYTLPIFKSRMYMVTSPTWATAVHRAHKTLYFNTLVAQAMKTLFCFDEEAMLLMNENANSENGTREGVMLMIHDMMQGVLAPGKNLDDLNKSTLDKVADHINELANTKEGERVKLYEWLRHHFSLASVTALWGPRNPFVLDPEAEAAFWEFEPNLLPLMLMPFPWLFARKAYLAREKIFKAFYKWMDLEAYRDPGTSQLIVNRANLLVHGEERYRFSKKMHAQGDASFLIGALANTVPTAFWVLSSILENDELLRKVRDEVDDCITTSTSDPKRRLVNVPKLRGSCPVFFCVFREVLRMMVSVNSNRFVAEDTIVTNNSTGQSYLLKKNSMVQIASNVIHRQPLWGDDVDLFNPERFLSNAEKVKTDASTEKLPDPAAPFRDSDGKLHSSAFRSFGGGNNICPGRYLAQTEVMGLVSLFVAGFEIISISNNGHYRSPQAAMDKFSMTAVKPGQDVEVLVKRRAGFEDVVWEFEM